MKSFFFQERLREGSANLRAVGIIELPKPLSYWVAEFRRILSEFTDIGSEVEKFLEF
nr:hypothetical protein [Candidatus Sigynarchaeota archaeon]